MPAETPRRIDAAMDGVEGAPLDRAATACPAPAISVIVPVYRDWHRLPGLIAALAAQTHPDFELVLVDNEPGATRHDEDLLSGLRFPWRRITCAQPGSYAARNAGAAAASGALLAFTDADCRPAPGWLAALARADQQRRNGDILAGPVELVAGPDPGPWEIFDSVRGIPQAAFIRHGYAATANLALRAATMHRLGGFDPARLSGGDAEFCRRALRLGARLSLVPEAVVLHPARTSRAELVTKARRIKGGQLAAGPWRRRLFWALRSLAPPVREIVAYLASPHPWSWRAVACAVRMRLWLIELAEMVRLLILRRPPERR
jgi:hypothetical protein